MRERHLKTMMKWILHALFVALSSGVLSSVDAEAQDSKIQVRISGAPEVAIPWDRFNCQFGAVADTPSRAYRDAAGMIHFFGTNSKGMALVGSGFDTLKQDCNPVYRSHEKTDPSQFRHYEWVQPYAIDGNRIFALIHNEFRGLRVADIAPQCPTTNRKRNGKLLSCWYASIQRGESNDGGYTFTSPEPPANFLFGIPYRFAPDMIRAGFGSRTMIKSPVDGYYYAFIGSGPYKAQKARGSCLARSRDLKDWRFWTGRDYTGTFVNPYVQDADSFRPEDHICPEVFTNDIMSVVYNEPLKTFVALTRKVVGDVVTFHYTTSSDLVNWSPRRTLFDATKDRGVQIFYPSFIDPDSKAQNFDVTDGKLFLYYVSWPESKGNGVNNKKNNIMRVPVTIEAAP